MPLKLSHPKGHTSMLSFTEIGVSEKQALHALLEDLLSSLAAEMVENPYYEIHLMGTVMTFPLSNVKVSPT